jgi:hypothetical protein
VKHAADYLRSVGVSSVGLYAYEHLIDFYGNLGFRRDRDFLVLRANNVAGSDPKEKTKAVGSSDLKRIIEFDRGCFGVSRERLLTQIIRKRANTTFVAKENGQFVGYGTTKVYQEMAEVGPLACLSTHPWVALELMDSLLNKIRGKEAYMCLPLIETALLDLATEFGFTKTFSVARMFLGSPFAQDCIYIAESLERG